MPPSVAVPVKVRDQVIGVLDAHKPAGSGEWTEEETGLLEELADQLGLALDSARLYQETQRRVVQERLTAEVAARMRQTLDVDTVLRTAVREMGAALGLGKVEVRMGVTGGHDSPGDRVAPTGGEGDRDGVPD